MTDAPWGDECDEGARAVEELLALGALDLEPVDYPDYYADLPEDRAPNGRELIGARQGVVFLLRRLPPTTGASRSSTCAARSGPGALDTKGGPVIDPGARVLTSSGEPIVGLYGAGNCIASPAGQAYCGAGGTIGLALTFGFVAGRNASTSPQRGPA